jgi:hypothetical protein
LNFCTRERPSYSDTEKRRGAIAVGVCGVKTSGQSIVIAAA